ncbi:MAG: S8 family serine peptidase [Opitutus sp.]
MVGTSVTLASTLQQPVNGYEEFDGTSMATPHVSGVAALIWSKYPGATNAQVRQALDGSAEDLGAVGRDPSYGVGLVQANNALAALAALNPAAPGDKTPPVISGLTARSTNSKNGSFEITWTTNEASSSDVTLAGTTSLASQPVTNHVRTFRGSRGATYWYSVFSKDAAGNTAISADAFIKLP